MGAIHAGLAGDTEHENIVLALVVIVVLGGRIPATIFTGNSGRQFSECPSHWPYSKPILPLIQRKLPGLSLASVMLLPLMVWLEFLTGPVDSNET